MTTLQAPRHPSPEENAAHERALTVTTYWMKYARIIFLPLSGLLILLMVWQAYHQNNTTSRLTVNENQNTKIILQQLGDMNAQLQQLANHAPHSDAFDSALAHLTTDITLIKQSVLTEQQGVKTMTQQMTTMQQEMETQRQDLRSILSHHPNKHYLDASVLPFRVIAIDVLAQQPLVSVDYQHHQTPLLVGDSMADWQLTAADYATAQAEFKNAHDQYVRVSLQGE